LQERDYARFETVVGTRCWRRRLAYVVRKREREVWREDAILRVEGRAFQVHLEVH
jgi:hypothetical protein